MKPDLGLFFQSHPWREEFQQKSRVDRENRACLKAFVEKTGLDLSSKEVGGKTFQAEEGL